MTQQADMLNEQWAGSSDAANATLGTTGGSWQGMAASFVSGYMKSNQKPAGQSGGGSGANQSDNQVSTGFDNSGWTVATGHSKAVGGLALTSTQWLIIGGAALIGVKLWKK